MEKLLCKECAYFRQSLLDPSVAFCDNLGAKTSDVDYVFGYRMHYQCKPMRESTNDCGPEGKWFKSKYED